jgi:asparagine synthase (glutamine-hydrolysing)
MCGIAGSVNINLNKEILAFINHRGPDYQELVERQIGTNKVFLGHTRLSILDLSPSGNQPMFTECGNYAIVFNGEIYNHLDLRKKLSEIHFKGHSDTETILYYIRKYGIESVNDFNGIFSFGFLDIDQQKIYLVKDHFGVKPLYYNVTGNSLIFSSELKVLLKAGINKRIDLNSLDMLLTLRYNPAPQTIFQDINKLAAGSYLVYDIRDHTCEKKSYFNSLYTINTLITENEAIEEYGLLLENAVKRQLQSDVPVGLFLSGGLDSALVGRIMMKHVNYPINTFTVGFKGEGRYNELDDAKVSSDFIGSVHSAEYLSQEQYLNYFRESFYYTEEPIAEPTIPALFHLSKMASRDVKVVLSGQGADEPMAGYKRYYGEQLMAKYLSILKFVPYNLAKQFFKGNETFQRGIYSSQFHNELDRFMAIYTIFDDKLKSKIYREPNLAQTSISKTHFIEKFYDQVKGKSDSLNRMLYIDTRTMLPDNLLLFNDKMTMAHSIENRVPFLDKDLVSFIETLPSNYKLRVKTHKYLEKKAAEKWLPQEFINRKKRGFETPVSDWFKKDLYNETIDLINHPNSLSSIYFNKNSLFKMLDLHKQNKYNYGKHIYTIYSLELWYQNFYLKF